MCLDKFTVNETIFAVGVCQVYRIEYTRHTHAIEFAKHFKCYLYTEGIYSSKKAKKESIGTNIYSIYARWLF